MIFAVACVVITGYLFQYIAIQNIEINIFNKNLSMARMISNQIDIYVEDAKNTVVTAANFSSQSHGDMEKIEEEIFRIYDNFPYFDLMFFMNKEGQMVFSKPSNDHVKNRMYIDRSYYWDIMEGKASTVSPLLISSVLKEAHFIIAAPVYNDRKEIIGLIGAGLPLHNIQRVVEKNQEHFSGTIWVTDENGIMAVHPDIGKLKSLTHLDEKQIIPNREELQFSRILEERKEIVVDYRIQEEEYYGAVSFVPNLDWMVVVEQKTDAVFLEITQLKVQLKNVIIMVIFTALIFGGILAHKITKPISILVKKVRKLGYGLREIQPINIQVDMKDEIGELNEAFHDMTMQLKESLKELHESYVRESQLQQYLNNILENAGSGIFVVDKTGVITIFNKKAEEISGFDAIFFINKRQEEFFERTKLNLEDILKDVIEKDKAFQDIEVTMKNSLGEEVVVSLTVSRALDKEKNIIGVIFLFRDISKIKMIEAELKREDRIKTLGELSASIIHDLGNPLAGISNLVEILKQDNYDEESKQEVLNVLEEEIKDLNRLVLDFLKYTHNTQHEQEKTNVNELMEGVIYLLKSEMINKTIIIKKNYHQDPLFIKVDRRGIKQALINILKNSIQAVEVDGKIDITIKKEEESVIICIGDNGMGMEEKELEKIFYPFYTTKKEGTGLGLWIAYKMIKEQEGYINVKSKKQAGTEIYITLPCME